jgi:O-antigen ligase
VLAIAAWPALGWLLRERRRALALGGWGLAGLGVGACASQSAQLAFLLASLGFLVAWRVGRTAAQVALVLAPAVVIAMPLLPFLAAPLQSSAPGWLLKPSAIHRVVIWRFADERIGERALLGWGLDAARVIPGGNEHVAVPDANGRPLLVERMPLHPHNGALQVWLELGAVGALVAALLAMVAASRLAGPSLEPLARAGGLAALIAAAVELSLSYGMWQSWWIAALWLAAFAVQLVIADPPADRPRTASP